MALDKTTNPDGSWEMTATGKDVAALRGAFRETNGVAVAKAREENRKNPIRMIRREDGSVIDVPGRMVERELAKGRTLADARIGITMPARFLGMDENGRVVYTEPVDEDWEPARTRLGHEGFALKAGR